MASRKQSRESARAPQKQGGASLGRWIALGVGTMVFVVVLGFLAARNPAGSFEWPGANTPDPELSIVPSPALAFHQLRAHGALVSSARRSANNGIGADRLVWSVNGEDVGEGALLAPEHFGRGDLVQVRVEQVLSRNSAKVRASASTMIANSPPRILSARIVRTPSRPQQVIANVEATDPDGDPLDYQLTWKVDGREWPSAQGKVVDITRLERGQTLSVDVMVDDGADQVKASSSPFALDNQPPSLAIAAKPDLEEGKDGARRAVLGATGHDPDGDPVVVEALDAPDGVRFDAQRGALIWSVMDGSQAFDVILRASDDRGGTAERTVTLKR